MCAGLVEREDVLAFMHQLLPHEPRQLAHCHVTLHRVTENCLQTFDLEVYSDDLTEH